MPRKDAGRSLEIMAEFNYTTRDYLEAVAKSLNVAWSLIACNPSEKPLLVFNQAVN